MDCRLSKMNGACEFHCCSAVWSLVAAWSTFWAFALPPFLLSLSDLSCASSNSFAMDARFPCIVDMCCISRLVDVNIRRGASTSFSIRCDRTEWELAISSVEDIIFFHGELNTLSRKLAVGRTMQLKILVPHIPADFLQWSPSQLLEPRDICFLDLPPLLHRCELIAMAAMVAMAAVIGDAIPGANLQFQY